LLLQRRGDALSRPLPRRRLDDRSRRDDDRGRARVWGEDAWCYVEDKTKLVAEAARLVKSGGTIAFTDWVEGPAGLSDEEAGAFLQGMKFPSVQNIEGYRSLLGSNGCEVAVAEDTGRFAPYVDLYLQMADMPLTLARIDPGLLAGTDPPEPRIHSLPGVT
jgi:SAM-dependent methyltransferase